ncbi:MAG: DUF1653 domain-containing protein [Pseudomonadota bacterium]
MPAIGSIWRHRKGGVYVVTGACRLEATDQDAVLYTALGGGGVVWARAASEFLDGRFDEVDPGRIAD